MDAQIDCYKNCNCNYSSVCRNAFGSPKCSVGLTTTVSSTQGGGLWTSSATGTATVDPSTGLITGIRCWNCNNYLYSHWNGWMSERDGYENSNCKLLLRLQQNAFGSPKCMCWINNDIFFYSLWRNMDFISYRNCNRRSFNRTDYRYRCWNCNNNLYGNRNRWMP